MKPAYLIAAGAVLAALLVASRGGVGAFAKDAAGAAVDMVDGVISGTVEGIGEKIGIPKTEVSRGQAAWERGDYWEASFYLPAGDFISNVWHKVTD